MNGSYGTKKYSADKMAFLAILIVALLLAYFLTVLKSGISLSKPIPLDGSGLTVAIPVGNGWKSENQWRYHENAFAITSLFVPLKPNPTALAYCLYKLAPDTESVDARFEKRASVLDAEIEGMGKITTDTLVFDWVHIKKQSPLYDAFFATAQLPNNRQLDIEVSQTTGDTALAERIFQDIIENLKFQDNQMLKSGTELLSNIKSSGLGSFLKKKNQQHSFLIKNEQKKTIGFLTESFIKSPKKKTSQIQTTSFYYLRVKQATEQVTFFEGDDKFGQFTWKSETSSRRGRKGVELSLGETEKMSVKNFDISSEDKNYSLNPAAIPEILLDFVFWQMLQSSYEKIVIDIIQPDGTITPTLISKIETQQTPYALKLQPLDGSGFLENIYFDNQMQISKAIFQQDAAYMLERTTKENIITQFPERAEYLLQRPPLK